MGTLNDLLRERNKLREERDQLRAAIERIGAAGEDPRGISFSRDQVEAWVGHVLTDDEVDRLEDVLPNSSLPDCVETVAHEALNIDPEGREGRR